MANILMFVINIQVTSQYTYSLTEEGETVSWHTTTAKPVVKQA